MEISITDTITLFAKVFAFICVGGYSAIWLLWPMNEQPTSKWQWTSYGVFMLIVFVLMFTNYITFKR